MLVADLELASAQMPLITNLHMSAPYATNRTPFRNQQNQPNGENGNDDDDDDDDDA